MGKRTHILGGIVSEFNSHRIQVPNAYRIRSAREAKQWSQEQLAERLKRLSSGWNPRTVQQLEGANPAFPSTLDDVATCLGIPRNEITADSILMQILREVVLSQTARLAIEVDLRGGRLPRAESVSQVLYIAALKDFVGNSSNAIKGVLQMVSHSRNLHNADLVFFTYAAAFCDHNRQYETGLRLIRDALHEAENVRDENYWWATYQEAVLLTKLDRHWESWAKLNEILQHGGAPYEISVLHQLGVICLDQARFGEAEAIFCECLERRKRRRFSFRLAYEYRRLAHVFAALNRCSEARKAFRDALAIAQSVRFGRYETLIRTDMKKLLAPS